MRGAWSSPIRTGGRPVWLRSGCGLVPSLGTHEPGIAEKCDAVSMLSMLCPPTAPPHYRVVTTARAPCYIQLRHGFGGEATLPPLPASSRSLSRTWQLAIYPDHLPAPISCPAQVRSVSAAERSRDEGPSAEEQNLLPLLRFARKALGALQRSGASTEEGPSSWFARAGWRGVPWRDNSRDVGRCDCGA
jgi:hypothetical protein